MDLFLGKPEEYENEEDVFLETDWIQEFEKIVDEGIYYPCESMISLPVYCLFVEKNTIIHISKKIIPFDFMSSSSSPPSPQGGCRNILPFLQKISKEPYWMEWMKDHTEFIGSEEALEIEEKRLEKRAKQFSLSDVLFFRVDLAMDDFEALGLDSSDGGGVGIDVMDKMRTYFFQSYSAEEWGRLEEFQWKDSVFLFHSINSVYFVFRDHPVVPIEVEDLTTTLSSPTSSVLVEMPVSSLVLGRGKMKRENTRKVRFWDTTMDMEMDDGDMVSSDSDMESETEEWGKGKWIQKRRKHRRKTEKRKHVFSPALIRSFFADS